MAAVFARTRPLTLVAIVVQGVRCVNSGRWWQRRTPTTRNALAKLAEEVGGADAADLEVEDAVVAAEREREVRWA